MREMGEKWIMEVKEGVKNMVDVSKETEHWRKHSIYKIPTSLARLKKNAFNPQMISLGPYHHGGTHVRPMEEHKRRALLHFLKRCGKPIETFVASVGEVVEDLKDSYEPLDGEWREDTERFLEVMIVDGCFMLEVLRSSYNGDRRRSDYSAADPVFSVHGMLHIMPYIKRDMLMLENQLPLVVLDRLLAVETEQQDEEFVNRLILRYFETTEHVPKLGKCKHVLDVYRKSLLQDPKGRPYQSWNMNVTAGGEGVVRSAIELDEAGIRFKKSKTTSLKDITFSGGVLRLPVIVVDDTTESMFLNLMAFERFHVGAGNHVTSYIFFMDNIIDTAADVALLHSRGIIQNAIGSDKAVAKLFNSLSKDVTLDPESSLDMVYRSVNRYTKQPWNSWRANLIHTYFRNPWSIVSLVAAFFLFALTIVQTVYTLLDFYRQQN